MPVLVAQLLLPLLGLVGPALVLLGLPGTWLLLALAGTCEWLTGPRLFANGTLWTALALALVGETLEFPASSVGAKRAGAGRRGALGALGGGILGAIAGTFLLPVPLVGTLVGGGLGAFAGSSALEHQGGRELREALRIGRAAGIGHLFGLAGKLVMAVATWLLLSAAVVWP